MFENGALVGSADNTDKTALIYLSVNSNSQIVKLLLTKTVGVNKK